MQTEVVQATLWSAICAGLFSLVAGQSGVLAGEQAEHIKAFPTAEGFGAFAKGGRGGRVIEVTNL